MISHVGIPENHHFCLQLKKIVSHPTFNISPTVSKQLSTVRVILLEGEVKFSVIAVAMKRDIVLTNYIAEGEHVGRGEGEEKGAKY